jgi:hypothetical protein
MLRPACSFPSALLACAIAGSSSSAWARDAARANALAESALVQAQQGDRRAAIRLYEAAWGVDARVEFMCAIAEQYDALAVAGELGDVRGASDSVEECLRVEGPTPRRARLARLREQVASRPAKPAMRTASIAVMISGAVLSAIGVPVLGLGIYNGSRCESACSGIGLFGTLAGGVVTGVGALHVAVGLGLWSVSAQRPFRAASTRALPSVAAGPRAISLTWKL